MSYIDFDPFNNAFNPVYSDKGDFNTNAKSYYDALARNKEFLKQFTDKLIHLHNEIQKEFEEHKEFTTEKIDGFQERLDGIKEEMKNFFAEWIDDGTLAGIINEVIFNHLNKNLNERGVNPLAPPIGYEACKGDGVNDDTLPLQKIINDFDHVILPMNKKFLVTDTIRIPNNKAVIGEVPPSGSGGKSAVLLYDGVEDRKKTVVLIGNNNVGSEPTKDGSGINVKNFIADGNKKIGFGFYGTYLTNETTTDGLIAYNTLEYGHYYARSWYASFLNLTARNNFGKGLSFGVPLTFQSGEKLEWTTTSPLEMNNTRIRNVRSHKSGLFYAEQNPTIFSITDERHQKQGYGIGFGMGHGFNVDTYTSEASGGVNLYLYTAHEESKSIRNGYIENPMVGSGVAGDKKTNFLIEHVSDVGGLYHVVNLFMNFNSGGIHFTGNGKRKVLLEFVNQPRFLKALNGLTDLELYSIVLKKNVYYQAGQYNTLENLAVSTHYEIGLNVRQPWKIQLIQLLGGAHLVYARLSKNNSLKKQPLSTLYSTNLDDNENLSFKYPTLTDEWVLVRNVTGRFNELSFGGDGGAEDTLVDFKIVTMPPTYL